ncbi:hypothetical protein BLA29_007962, partial [Euroglyphus maynei]
MKSFALDFSNRTRKNSDSSHSKHPITTSSSQDDNEDYIMFTPGSTEKNNRSNILSKSLPEQNIINRKSTTFSNQITIAPLATSEILSDSVPQHLAEEEEESSY